MLLSKPKQITFPSCVHSLLKYWYNTLGNHPYISRQDNNYRYSPILNIPESERLISFFGLLYLLLWILHFQKILSISVLFRSLTVDFFFTAWSWWETQTQISLIFCWKPKQIALHGQNGFPTSNQRVLRLDLGISKPHAK